jgi:hypothetical protein
MNIEHLLHYYVLCYRNLRFYLYNYNSNESKNYNEIVIKFD